MVSDPPATRRIPAGVAAGWRWHEAAATQQTGAAATAGELKSPAGPSGGEVLVPAGAGVLGAGDADERDLRHRVAGVARADKVVVTRREKRRVLPGDGIGHAFDGRAEGGLFQRADILIF